MQPPKISFQPVQLKARHDGWTAARQVRFIEELAATKSIARASRVVGMSRESAYKLRDRAESVQFRLAWNAALRPEFDRPVPAETVAKFTFHRQRNFVSIVHFANLPRRVARGGTRISLAAER